MKDILGRELKENDIVVCMAIGRYSKGMFLGIQTDKGSILTLDGRKDPCNRFLVTNPTDEELEIVRQIKEKYQSEKEQKLKLEQERKAKKAIPYKDLKFCYIYEDDKGDEYVFLGKCNVDINVTDEYNSKSVIESGEGYVYLSKNNLKYFTDLNYIENLATNYKYRWSYNYTYDNVIKLTKSKRRLVKEIGLCKELCDYLFCYDHTSFIIRGEKISIFKNSRVRYVSYKIKRID